MQKDNSPSNILDLEAKLKQVTQQRNLAFAKINWICDQLSTTRLSFSQQKIKKQLELETKILIFQIDFDDEVRSISEEEQYQKLKTFPLKGQLIG